MVISINKTVGGVDFGISGKKTVNLELRLELKGGKWEFFCYYAYFVLNNGTKVPVGQDIMTIEFLKTHINDAIDEMKTMDSNYEFKANIK